MPDGAGLTESSASRGATSRPEQPDVVRGVLVTEVAALAEEQQVPDAAHPGGEIADLAEHIVRRAGEHGVGVHELLHRRAAVVDHVALPVLDDAMRARSRLHDRHIGTDRVVAWRIGERLGDHRRGAHIIGDLIGPPQPFLPRGADTDHGGIGHAGPAPPPSPVRVPARDTHRTSASPCRPTAACPPRAHARRRACRCRRSSRSSTPAASASASASARC